MKVEAYKATVENGQIKLVDRVQLAEHSRVFVVVPVEAETRRFRIRSPRLAQPAQAAEFVKEVAQDRSHDGV